jgi:hypothetical protein
MRSATCRTDSHQQHSSMTAGRGSIYQSDSAALAHTGMRATSAAICGAKQKTSGSNRQHAILHACRWRHCQCAYQGHRCMSSRVTTSHAGPYIIQLLAPPPPCLIPRPLHQVANSNSLTVSITGSQQGMQLGNPRNMHHHTTIIHAMDITPQSCHERLTVSITGSQQILPIQCQHS